jgi:hypothetical protein
MTQKQKIMFMLNRILNTLGLKKEANQSTSVDNSLTNTHTVSNRKLFILGGVRVNVTIKCDSENNTDGSGSFHVNRSTNKSGV